VASEPSAKKQRVYEVAKDLGMSSDVILQISKKLGVELKNHMSTLTPEDVGRVRAEMGKEKAAAREVVVRQQEHEAQRSREVSRPAPAAPAPSTAAAPAAGSAPTAPRPAASGAPAPPRPATGPSAPRPAGPSTGPRPGYGSGAPGSRPGYGGPGSGPRPGYGGGPGSGPRPGYSGGPRPGGPGGGARPGYGGPGSGPRPGYGGPSSGPRPGYGGPSSGSRPGFGGGPGAGRPSGGGGGGRPGFGGGASSGASTGAPGRPGFGGPGGPGGRGQRRDRNKKKRTAADDRQTAESVRRTLASLDTGGARRKHRRREDEAGGAGPEEKKTIKAAEFITVAELAQLMQVRPQEAITALMQLGSMATINKRLDKDTITMVADEFGFEVEFSAEYGEEPVVEADDNVVEGVLQERPAVVTIMGHVDHGKTSLLDYVRRTNVVAGESGGITQHIGAYEVTLPSGQRIAFLDTPGHEAFTAMRARGAQVTDIVILVVAADDRVMPQTLEAIDHAKAADVPIIVAINKIDLPTADPLKIKTQLAEAGVVVEEFGGKYACIELSAKKGINVEKLLEMVLLTAEVLELKADPTRTAKGVVIEARVEQGRGVVASVLVQTGTLRVGDAFVSGPHFGRVRAMYDERRRQVKEAPPSTPVEVVGWSGVPSAGDQFIAKADEREARELATKRAALRRESEINQVGKVPTLTEFFSQMAQGGTNELKLVIKGDVDGSVEALAETLQKLSNNEVAVRVIRRAVGQISESDVLLAQASSAIIVGFHVRPDVKARELAEREKVEIRLYDIIYKAVEDVKSALEGLLKPEIEEVVLGSAEVRAVFKLSKGLTVAGCMVTTGTIKRSEQIRLFRGDEKLWSGRLLQLKRFKDDVREVEKGFECGITLDGYNDVQEGDRVEAFTIKEVARSL